MRRKVCRTGIIAADWPLDAISSSVEIGLWMQVLRICSRLASPLKVLFRRTEVVKIEKWLALEGLLRLYEFYANGVFRHCCPGLRNFRGDTAKLTGAAEVFGALQLRRSRKREMPNTGLLDLSDDNLITIFHALDLQTLVTVARAAKRLNAVLEHDIFWLELCRPWEDSVDLKSWRGRLQSGRAVYRLLRSLDKLVGLWTHRSHNPRGELLYVTWSACGVDGWQVIPGTFADNVAEAVKFVRVFSVIGRPDGSHKTEASCDDTEDVSHGLPSTLLVLPSSRSSNQFSLIRLSMARGQYLEISSHEGEDTAPWRQLYKRLEISEPNREQELLGLWIGQYGTHGWEIVTVSYSDEGFVIGTKVIGDPNVPSGEVTFKAFLNFSVDFSSLYHLGAPLRHEQSLEFIKMYRGQIALENFLHITWVQGALFIERSGNVCFVADFDSYRLRFHRLDLASCFRKKMTETKINLIRRTGPP